MGGLERAFAIGTFLPSEDVAAVPAVGVAPRGAWWLKGPAKAAAVGSGVEKLPPLIPVKGQGLRSAHRHGSRERLQSIGPQVTHR